MRESRIARATRGIAAHAARRRDRRTSSAARGTRQRAKRWHFTARPSRFMLTPEGMPFTDKKRGPILFTRSFSDTERRSESVRHVDQKRHISRHCPPLYARFAAEKMQSFTMRHRRTAVVRRRSRVASCRNAETNGARVMATGSMARQREVVYRGRWHKKEAMQP